MKIFIDGYNIAGTIQDKKSAAANWVVKHAENKGYDLADALMILQNALNGCGEAWDTMAADFGIEVLA